jgi:hypothetical protein
MYNFFRKSVASFAYMWKNAAIKLIAAENVCFRLDRETILQK